MERSGVRIGPFELLHPLGAGGMGEVWAATHVNARVDVAVKVIATEVAWSDRFRRAFRNEVRAAATLDHPGIVQVLDAGEITAAAAIASEGRLIAGSPWFVTERLVGGSLVDWVRSPRTWPELADLSQALLEALAHAHARGVIHRDVKPSNVLLDAGGRPRLTDFGIAQLQDARRGAGPAGAIAGQDGALEDLGTPAYLAPEQLLRVRAAIGPWTDLYAFGCTLWALVCGRPPFGDLRGESLRRAQLDPERPPLRPVLAVPTGLERVLHRTIAAAPNARYCRAIELATELGRLGGADRPAEAAPRPASPAPAPARDPSPSIPTVSIPTVSIPTVSIPTASVPVGGEGSEAALPSAPRAASVAPTVPDAIPADSERTTRALRGAGIGLFGLRAAPIVGRRAERQLLWDAFVPASRGQGPRVVVLTGPSGTGKTRLATWLCESAHALAGAEVWTAEHGPTDGGLDTLLASWLGVRSPRSSPELASVLAVRLAALPPGEPIEPEVVGELVAPTGRVRFTKPHERYAVIVAIIRRIAAERPVVLRLEDVQWGADALGLVAALHEAAIRRLTMVLTARDEVLAERPIERPLIRALVARPGASEIAVGPLPRRDRQRLIHALLPLEPSLAVRVAEHTGGNPLFTVQLVGELVANGSLEADESGFRLKTEATTGASLAEIWTQRLEALLAGASGAAGIALELAAVLGMHVDGAEWRAVVDEAGAFVPPRLADRLVEAGLARTEGDPDEGFTFVHAMLRDVLLARAEDSGRLDGHHTAAAGWLAAQVGPGVTLRRGRHLLEAGSARAATEPLLDAAAELVSQAQFAEAVGVLASWEAAMTRAGIPARDTRWGRGFRIRFELAYRSGDFDAAEAHAQRVHDHAKWHGWPDLEFRAVLDLATLSGARGERELAAARVARALAMPVAADPLLAAHGRQAEGMVHAMQGDHAAARIAFDEATLRFERLGEPVEAANAARFGALAALRSGDTSGAIDAASSARERFVRLGHRPGIAAVDNTLGEAHRATGDLASAEQWYRSARDGMRRLGMGRVVVPETNLAIVLLDLGRPGEARAMLEAIARDPACRIRASIHAAVRALLLAASADERDWPAVDAAIGLARDAIGVGGRVDPDTDRALLRAVRAARAAGDEPRAAAIEALLAEP